MVTGRTARYHASGRVRRGVLHGMRICGGIETGDVVTKAEALRQHRKKLMDTLEEYLIDEHRCTDPRDIRAVKDLMHVARTVERLRKQVFPEDLSCVPNRNPARF